MVHNCTGMPQNSRPDIQGGITLERFFFSGIVVLNVYQNLLHHFERKKAGTTKQKSTSQFYGVCFIAAIMKTSFFLSEICPLQVLRIN